MTEQIDKLTDEQKKRELADIDDALYHVDFGIKNITEYLGTYQWLKFLRSEVDLLLSSEQAAREEIELLTKHCEIQDKMLSSLSKQSFETGIKLNQAVEVLKRILNGEYVYRQDMKGEIRDFLSSLSQEGENP